MKTEILKAIWERSECVAHYPYVATINRRTSAFSEVTIVGDRPWDIHMIQYDQIDSFFSPLLFKGARKNENAALPGVLFADLDRVGPDDLAQAPNPSVLWSTSPGNYQAVWFLAEAPLDAVRWADVNKRLTYATHADKGGWHASKLLRIPETRNFKYAEAPLGTVLSFTEQEVSFTELESTLPTVDKVYTTEGTYPEPPSQARWLRLCRVWWDDLTMEQRSILASPRQLDRSDAIVRLANSLERSGIHPAARFNLIWGVAWNKWRTDRHRPEMLWRIINHA